MLQTLHNWKMSELFSDHPQDCGDQRKIAYEAAALALVYITLNDGNFGSLFSCWGFVFRFHKSHKKNREITERKSLFSAIMKDVTLQKNRIEKNWSISCFENRRERQIRWVDFFLESSKRVCNEIVSNWTDREKMSVDVREWKSFPLSQFPVGTKMLLWMAIKCNWISWDDAQKKWVWQRIFNKKWILSLAI